MIVFGPQAESYLARHELSQIEHDSSIEPGDVFVVNAGRVELADDGDLILTGHDGARRIIGSDASKAPPPPPPKPDRATVLQRQLDDQGRAITSLSSRLSAQEDAISKIESRTGVLEARTAQPDHPSAPLKA